MHDRGAGVKSKLSHTNRFGEGRKGRLPRFRVLPVEQDAGPWDKILRTVVSKETERCRGSIRRRMHEVMTLS